MTTEEIIEQRRQQIIQRKRQNYRYKWLKERLRNCDNDQEAEPLIDEIISIAEERCTGGEHSLEATVIADMRRQYKFEMLNSRLLRCTTESQYTTVENALIELYYN